SSASENRRRSTRRVVFLTRPIGAQAGHASRITCTDSLRSPRFLPQASPDPPDSGKFFRAPRGSLRSASSHPRAIHLRRRCPARTRVAVVPSCEEMPAAPAFLRFTENREIIARRKRSQAWRAHGRVNRRADRSSQRSVVVHHSLSGFAVFFVVL